MKHRYKVNIKEAYSEDYKNIVIIFETKENKNISQYIYENIHLMKILVLIGYMLLFAIGIFGKLKWISLTAGFCSLLFSVPIESEKYKLLTVLDRFIINIIVSFFLTGILYFLAPEITLSEKLKFLRTDSLGQVITFIGLLSPFNILSRKYTIKLFLKLKTSKLNKHSSLEIPKE